MKYSNYNETEAKGTPPQAESSKMKTTFALSLLVVALVPACTTTRTTSTTGTGNYKASYANTSTGEEPFPPGEGPEVDIPSEGPADVNANPAYIPTPLLRSSAAAGP